MAHTTSYPVHVEARLDPQLSRWQWLFKWLLAIPHYVVLLFLWAAFVLLSIVAFFAILFTGRYPRAIFDFNVGVLRWSWRVTYYAYGALGTDRYPPFSLAEEPDYPAHLEVDYPEHLSRGLALVKSWLLAIPHYIVVGLFLGGVTYAVAGADDDLQVASGGLIGLLVLIAAIILLFTGRYPQPLFDFVLGLNRWVLRVAGYAALMTDEYPPFRLDQGGSEPEDHGTVMVSPPPDTSPAGAMAPPPPSSTPVNRWPAGRVIALVVGTVMVLTSLGVATAGISLAVANATMRDDAGFLMSGEESLTTDTFAISTPSLELDAHGPSAVMPQSLLGDARVTVTTESGSPVFVGLASSSDVATYLDGVSHVTLTDVNGGVSYRAHLGDAPTAAPADQGIWVAQAQGTGTQSITWPLENGEWTLVLMNADGTAAIAADVAVGAEVPALTWLVAGLLVAAAVGLVVGGVLIALPVRSASKVGEAS